MKVIPYSRYFYTFLIFHIICWTLIPTFLQGTPPLDVIEALAWGQQWQWGYDKDPFLVPWVLGLVNQVFGTALWPLFLLSQLAVISCFWAVWRLAQYLHVDKLRSLIAVTALEGIFYYNYTTPEFNDNILLLPTWSFLCLCFYSAIRDNKLLAWVGVGLFAGLALMAKYSTVMLLLSLFIFLLAQAEARQCFKKPGFYLALGVFLIIIAPNMYWLIQHKFITIFYAIDRAQSDSYLLPHLLNPLQFLIGQLLALIPVFGLLSLLSYKRAEKIMTHRFNRHYLMAIGLGPFIAMILFSTLSGLQLRYMWATPLFSFIGLFYITHMGIRLERAKLRRFFSGVASMFIFYLLIYVAVIEFGSYFTKEGKTAHFPGRQIADTLTVQWHNTYNQPLKFVGGSRWLAGNIAYFSSDRPAAFFDWDIHKSPWIDMDAVNKTGAIFVWDSDIYGKNIPETLARNFPKLQQQSPLTFAWRSRIRLAPIHLGVAFLPPRSMKFRH